MKAIFLSCAAILVLSASGCAEKVEDRPLNASECRELTTLELDLSIQAGRIPNIDAGKKEKLLTGRRRIASRPGNTPRPIWPA